MRAMSGATRLVFLASVMVVGLVLAPVAGADLADERALAEKYAPIVRIVEQRDVCSYGEPFLPTDIDLLLGEETVALRGPWNVTDLVEIAPTANDLVNRFEYHLDFPGDALAPGCDYNRWARRLTQGSKPVAYAHVVGENEKLALQYWFFYPFNDFNNTHEGDWEMIQLVFDADDASEALEQEPDSIGYSSHEGAERASWDDDKLAVVDETHPVVYPSAGSHANKFTEAFYLGSSAEAGVGCDDTRGPHRELRPAVETIPSDPDAGAAAFPWIDFEGRWGELQKAFFNGPTGPNMKKQWTEPISWSDGWREKSYAVPTGGLFGTGATDLFCTGVERGSRALVLFLQDPALVALVLAAVIALVAFVTIRATWTPVAPLRLGRRRSWGQILSASGSMYVRHPRVFLGIGLLLIPVTLAITLLQWLVLEGLGLVGVSSTGEGAGCSAFLALIIGTMLALLGLGLVQAATACALREIDTGRRITAVSAYAEAFERVRPLLRAIGLFVLVWVVLTTTTFLIPVAIWLAIRWCLLAPVVELEERGGRDALRRSRELVRGRWWRTASLVGLSAAISLGLGPLLGALLIFVVDAPLATLNIVAGIVYAAALPFVGLVTAYVYFDARTRVELEPVVDEGELPAEIELARG
jgi:Membrane domain of glycerophosphoryl diester phosphodiesterase